MNRLPGMFANVKNRSITTGFHAQFTGQLGRDDKEVSHVGGIGLGHLRHAGDVPFGNDEDMDRGLRIDIVECESAIVLVRDIHGDFTLNHSTKEASGHFVILTKNSKGLEISARGALLERRRAGVVLGNALVDFTLDKNLDQRRVE